MKRKKQNYVIGFGVFFSSLRFTLYAIFVFMCFCVLVSFPAFAQQEVSLVEVNGDHVEFDIKERKVIATGNVSISKSGTVLTCDRVEFYRDTEIAHAFGHVVLKRGGETLEGENLVFNFKTLRGDFEKPLLTAPPLYGSGERIEKIGENHFRIYNGYISTCDFDDPQSRINAKVIDVYPGDVAIARNMVLKAGKVPIFIWPKYTKNLKEHGSIVQITPGYKSDWGGFLLSRWRFDRKSSNFKTFVHVDYRERKDLAWGIDNEYDTTILGEGLIRTYYMNERDIGNNHIWDERTTPTIERERYKIEWRHRWKIDDTSSVTAQVYKLSDGELLKEYFEEEYDLDQNPKSYVVATKGLHYGTLTARTDFRVNRFTSTVDRLPEVGYILPNIEIFNTNFYLKNSTTYSSLWKKNASPTDAYAKTKRIHINNEISYPAKVSFIEVRPFVGAQHTYYSRTKEEMMQDKVRGVFKTGIDLSTKFYRIYEKETNAFNLEIDKLRHVITPSIAYSYQANPTVQAGELDQYDSIDALARTHIAILSLENKIQTKRDGESVDLVRFILSTPYNFKQESNSPSRFGNINADLEVTPYKWLGFYSDSAYDPHEGNLVEANFDLYINNPSDIWYLRLGERYHDNVDHQLETEVGWRINPKWSVSYTQILDIKTGDNGRRNISVRRDLHSWLMDVSFTAKKVGGQELLIIFTLKGFDDVQIEGGRRYRVGSERPGAN